MGQELKKLYGHQIKVHLRNLAEEIAGIGLATDFRISERGVPYVQVFIKHNRYHIVFFGKHQFYRVFKASDPNNPHVDFKRGDGEGMFEYFVELAGGLQLLQERSIK